METLKGGARDLYLWHQRMYVVDLYQVSSGHRSARRLDRGPFHTNWQARRDSPLLSKYKVVLPPLANEAAQAMLGASTSATSESQTLPATSPPSSQRHDSTPCVDSSTHHAKVHLTWPAHDVSDRLQQYCSEHHITLSASSAPYMGKDFVRLRFSCHRGPHDRRSNTTICEHHNPRKYIGRQNRGSFQQVGCNFAINIHYPFQCAPTTNPLTGADIDYTGLTVPDTMHVEDAPVVRVTISAAHRNHTPGSLEDAGYMSVQKVWHPSPQTVMLGIKLMLMLMLCVQIRPM
jgi:hypothetical protein